MKWKFRIFTEGFCSFNPRGVLGVGDDRRIFSGLKFSIPGFFLGRKNLASIFWGGLIFKSWDFLGIQNNLKIRGSHRVSRPRSSANKVQPNVFVTLQQRKHSATVYLCSNTCRHSFHQFALGNYPRMILEYTM